MAVVIVLNGTSSSGKTSIAKELQKQLSNDFLHVPLDSFFHMIKDDCFDLQINDVVTATSKYIRGLADQGGNVIYDTVFYDPRLRYEELSQELSEHDVIWVKVICSDLSELKSRESNRGDRPNGVSESEMSIVYNDYPFNIEVDTSSKNLNESTNTIMSYMKS